MEMRLNVDPITGKKRLDIPTSPTEKEIVDEVELLRKKEYLETSILQFQTELDEVNEMLQFIYDQPV